MNVLVAENERSKKLLKNAIWLYFFLLIFEGGLRKWILPGLSTPLLLIRDPLAIFLIYQSFKSHYWKPNMYVFIVWSVSIISFSASLLVGHQNLAVAFYGLRITLLHFPLIFIIGKIFNYQDVIHMGKVLLIVSIPMTLLIALQFYSPQSAFVNRGVGGDIEGAGFSGAMGFFRPPGTFSFTNGNALFYQMAGVFLVYFWLVPKWINRLLLLVATIALVISIPLSFSRGLLFSLCITFIFALFTAFKNSKLIKRILFAVVGFGVFIIVISQLEFVSDAIEAFTYRFEAASKFEGGVEGTLIDRFLGSMFSAFDVASKDPFFGYGLGMGTNAGSQMLTGEREFLIAEGEWGRLIGEMGLLLGGILIFVRIFFAGELTIRSWKLTRRDNILPWLMLSFALPTIIQGQWAQPTFLGFSILISGLVVASLKGESVDTVLSNDE